MTRYERRIYFERLIELRTAYATAGDDDRTAAITIDEAVAEAEIAFADLIEQDQAALRGAPVGPSSADHADESGKVR